VATSGNGNNHLGVNLSFTKFLFVTVLSDDGATHTRVKDAGGMLARGFFNDFDSDGTREPQPLETIQFLIGDPERESTEGLLSARYVAHVSAKYRPRLQEIEEELKRRVGQHATVTALDGAVQVPRYTSAEMHAFAYKHAVSRTSGRAMRNAIIIPIRKTPEWWKLDPLERHSFFYPHTSKTTGTSIPGHARAAEAGVPTIFRLTFFYPHTSKTTGTSIPGHARAAEAGVPTIFRRLYHNPDGYEREDEYDFVTYFECTDENLPVFDQVHAALRDQSQNPEWRYVAEGPEWRGTRVLRW